MVSACLPGPPWLRAEPPVGGHPPAEGLRAPRLPSLSRGKWAAPAAVAQHMHLTASRGSKDREELRGEADLQGFPAEVRQFLHPHLLCGFLQRPVGTSDMEARCFSPAQEKAPLSHLPVGGGHLDLWQGGQHGPSGTESERPAWLLQGYQSMGGPRAAGTLNRRDPRGVETPGSELQMLPWWVGMTQG